MVPPFPYIKDYYAKAGLDSRGQNKDPWTGATGRRISGLTLRRLFQQLQLFKNRRGLESDNTNSFSKLKHEVEYTGDQFLVQGEKPYTLS